MAKDWREYATVEAFQAFADAQARLDEGDYPDGEAGHVLRQCDEALTDRYDRLVLQPAQWERIAQDDNAEFARHFPEPTDGSRIEWEYDGFLWAAYRQDQADGNGDWWLYGRDDDCYSWRRLVVEYRIQMADLTVLVDASKAVPSVEVVAHRLHDLARADLGALLRNKAWEQVDEAGREYWLTEARGLLEIAMNAGKE